MGFYADTSLALLCKQIARDNPDAPPITKDNIIVLGKPTAVNTNGRNTAVTLNGKMGAGFSGRRVFSYDRLNLTTFFNGITVTFNANGDSTVVADLLPGLNERYGLGLTRDDINNPDVKLGTGFTPTEVTLVINVNVSLAYTGSLKVLWSRTPTGIFPDSGPGSKLMLIGNKNEGYFGTVTQAEMLTTGNLYDAVSSLLPATLTPVFNPNLLWIKFALDGDFYFFPTDTVITGTSWKLLNDAGMAKGDAEYPLVAKAGDGTNLFFELCLPRAATDDPMGPVRNDPGSLSARILNKVHTAAYGTGEWGDVKPNTGGYFLWLNHYTDGSLDSVFRSSMNQANVSSIKETTIMDWRPMVKVVDGKLTVVPIRNVISQVYGKLLPPALSIDQSRDPLILVRIVDVIGKYNRGIDIPVLSVEQPKREDTVRSVKNVTGTRYLEGIGIAPTLSYKAEPQRGIEQVGFSSTLPYISPRITFSIPGKVNLKTTDGELLSFQ